VARARQLLDQAIERGPLDATNHESLGLFLWRQSLPDEALKAFARAVELNPGFDRGWDAMRSCASAYGRDDFVEGQARELTRRRPMEARSWLILARSLVGANFLEEQLATVDC